MSSEDLTALIHRSPEDDAAWDAWFHEIYPKVLYVAARKASGDVELAEEVTQGAMERFLRYGAYERVDSDRSAVAYLVQTAMRLMIDERRRRAREVPLAPEALAERSETTSEEDDDVESLLAYVSEDERRLLRMVLNGDSVREISERLGVGYSAVAMRIHRAKARLRARLREV